MNAKCRIAIGLAAVLLSAQAVANSPPVIPDWKPRPPDNIVWRPPVLVVPARNVTPIQVQTLRVTGEANGRQAVTEIDMTFYNPNGRVLEGELQFPLFDGQSVASFAMDVNGKMRDAVPVDKARGQAVFEDVIRGRIDPGLLEVTQGNSFKLRVYPIPARGTKRVVIRISETLASDAGRSVYRLPLGFAQRAGTFTLEVKINGADREPEIRRSAIGGLEFSKSSFRNRYHLKETRSDFAGEGMIEIAIAESSAPVVQTEFFQGKTYVVADVAIPRREVLREIPKLIGLVWDSSASARNRDHVREFQILDAYFNNMRDGEVRLTEIRDVADAPRNFRISNGDWTALRNALEATAYDGATNLHAFVPDNSVREYLMFSDGLSNFGNVGSKPFAETRVPLFTISAAVKTDATFLRHIAQRSGARHIDLTRVTGAAAANALLSTASRIVDVSGATSVVRSASVLDGGHVQIAGIVTELPANIRVNVLHPDGKREATEVAITAAAAKEASSAASTAANTWATMRVAELDAEYQFNRAEIRRLGQRFRLVTRETSLIILDRIEDYARFEIEPPSELRGDYDRVISQFAQQRRGERQSHLENIVRAFEEKVRWWNHSFPKTAVYRAESAVAKLVTMGGMEASVGMVAERSREDRAARKTEGLAPPAPAMAAPPSPTSPSVASVPAGVRAFNQELTAPPATSTIRLQKWQPDAPYLVRLRAATDADLYRIYLDEAPGRENSTAFYLDVADIFFERKMNALGVRVLSNLAEMDLENRHILRILGHRLMQASRAELAIPTFKRVLELSPDEPQSYRDLGLAYAADKQAQKAVDSLYEVVVRPWHGRFPGVESIAIAELNAIAATARVDTSRMDQRLVRNLPLDLRAVLTWDADNTDIDLWVTDPNGEKAFYGNQRTYQGGRMSADFTGGYGPEEFSLKQAKPGKYKIEAQYFGDRRQNVTGATTLQLRLTTGFGSARQRDEMITLRLKDGRETVFVGEITVGG